MKTLLQFVFLTLALSAVCGCIPRSRTLESFQAATTVNPNPMPGKGDKGSFGGTADGSGGRNSSTSYATSKKGQTKVVTATLP